MDLASGGQVECSLRVGGASSVVELERVQQCLYIVVVRRQVEQIAGRRVVRDDAEPGVPASHRQADRDCPGEVHQHAVVPPHLAGTARQVHDHHRVHPPTAAWHTAYTQPLISGSFAEHFTRAAQC